ncbi:hypothetical protein OAO01_00070 [Oligoflexia bacterium]|nr:hypothetical protein [Oligoflexia bacterium]
MAGGMNPARENIDTSSNEITVSSAVDSLIPINADTEIRHLASPNTPIVVQPATGYEQPGSYAEHNGWTMVIDHQGVKRLGPMSAALKHELSERGFMKVADFVPLANGEEFVSTTLQRKLMELSRGASDEKKSFMLGQYRHKAASMMLLSVNANFVLADGAEVMVTVGREKKRDQIPLADGDGVQMPPGRFESVGKFRTSFSLISYMNGDGQLWVAPYSDQTRDALEVAGYEHDPNTPPLGESRFLRITCYSTEITESSVTLGLRELEK